MDKERLRQYQAIKHELAQVGEQIEELQAVLYGPKAQQMDGMPFAPSGGSSDAREAMLDKKAQLLAHYEQLREDLTAEQLAIEQAIEQLEPRLRTLLRLRYLDGLRWEEVCTRMSYSWQQVHRMHRQALARLREAEDE